MKSISTGLPVSADSCRAASKLGRHEMPSVALPGAVIVGPVVAAEGLCVVSSSALLVNSVIGHVPLALVT